MEPQENTTQLDWKRILREVLIIVLSILGGAAGGAGYLHSCKCEPQDQQNQDHKDNDKSK